MNPIAPLLPPPESAFFVIPANLEFLTDRAPFVSVPSPLDKGKGWGKLLMVFIPIQVVAILAVIWLNDAGPFGWIWNFAYVIFAMVSFVTMVLWAEWRNNQRITRRLADEGQLLAGKIRHCRGESRNSGYRGAKEYHLIIEYDFIAPDGSSIIASRDEVRDDLAGKPLPASEAPIYILYFGASEYYLL